MKVKLLVLFLLLTFVLQAQKKDLYLLIGQSNMAGRGDFENAIDSTKIKGVFLLNDKGEFENAKNPLNRYSTIRKVCEPNLMRVGLGASFSKEMARFLKDSVYLIVNARGGISIDKFLKGADDGYYETTLNRTRNALNKNENLTLKAILWHQGESDSNNAEEYLKKLSKIVTDFRKDFNIPQLPFIAGELGEWNSDYNEIMEKILMIPKYIDNSYLVSSKRLKNRDTHHFNTSSYKKLGKRYAEICKKAIYKFDK